jgi:hypothetical protein
VFSWKSLTVSFFTCTIAVKLNEKYATCAKI